MQGAACGEGLRRRNLSCVVHWGNGSKSPPQPVGEEELCGDKLRRRIQQEMEQPCFVPCPGKAAPHTQRPHNLCYSIVCYYCCDCMKSSVYCNTVICANSVKLHNCMNYVLLWSFWIHNSSNDLPRDMYFFINNYVFNASSFAGICRYTVSSSESLAFSAAK